MPSAAYNAAAADYSKRVQWLVEIDLDRCDETYTQGACTAADAGDGARCYYSFPTCQDSANFNKTTRTYRFCLNDVPWPDSATAVYPLLKKLLRIPQRVNTRSFFSFPDSLTLDFYRDWSPPAADSDKGAGFFNTGSAGEFWRNLFSRNRNYSGRAVRIYRGFDASGFVYSDFEQVGPDYRISAIKIDRSGCRVTIESPLVKLRDKKLPWAINENNVVENNPLASGGTTLTVTDGGEFPDPADYSRNSIYVEIEDDTNGDEIVRVTALAGNDLTVVRAQWGTSANEHAQGLRVRHVAIFGTSSKGPVNSIDTLRDLLEWAGVATADIDTTAFDTIKALYWPDDDVVRIVRTTRSIGKLMQEIRDPRGLLVYLNNSQKWTASSLQGQAEPTASYDDDSIRNVNVMEDDETRRTRVALWYDPVEDSAKDPADFRKAVIVIDTDLETANNYGDEREQEITDNWLYPELAAAKVRLLAFRLITRSAHGERRIQFDLEVKDGTRYVGDTITIQTKELTDFYGTQLVVPCVIVSREEAGRAVMRFEAIDTNYSGRFFRWGPDTMTDDYDSATEADKGYGYWGDSANRVGSSKVEGYKVF